MQPADKRTKRAAQVLPCDAGLFRGLHFRLPGVLQMVAYSGEADHHRSEATLACFIIVE